MNKRFWIIFDGDNLPIGFQRGCGVTARNYNDALALLRDKVFSEGNLPEISEVIEDVDISKLDEAHVLPNLGNVSVRGIWFPMGYQL